MARVLRSPFALALLLLAALFLPARADIPWPANGAPVCTAPGEQHGLVAFDRLCGDGMSFSWFTRATAGDTLEPFGSIGVSPPTGGCTTAFPAVPSNPVTGVMVTCRVSSGLVMGIPGCFDPAHPGHAWIAAAGASEQVVLSVPLWGAYGFSPSVVVHTANAGAHGAVAIAGSGQFGDVDSSVVVVWVDRTSAPASLRAQRVTWRGALAWGGADGIVLAAAVSESGTPQALRLYDGSTLVVWTDARGGSLDTYALRLLADGTPTAGWPATGLALEDRSEQSATPRLPETYGAPFVVWEESGARFGGGRSIVVRRLLADGRPDPAWSDSGVVVSSSATVDELEDAQGDYVNGVAVVWSDTRAASSSNPTDLYAQRIALDGTRPAGWPAAGLALCTAPGRQDHARVSVHSDGSSVYAWEDGRGAESAVYVTLRGPQGQTPCCDWVLDGTPVSRAQGPMRNPVIRAGNAGGAFVAWEDGRDLATHGYDIYAQAFTADGRNADVEPRQPVDDAILLAPAPNPSRGLALLELDLPRAANLRLDVFDITGRHVRAIARGTFGPGAQQWRWDGADDAGRPTPAGLYRVRALVDGVPHARTVVRMR